SAAGRPAQWRGPARAALVAERPWCCHGLLAALAVAVVRTPAALSLPLLPPAEFRERTFALEVAQTIDRETLVGALDRAGYERVDAVAEVGQWSLRGGIVDIFSPGHERPVRAEFLGDDVESLRAFDPTTQRSVEPLDELTIVPLCRADAG